MPKPQPKEPGLDQAALDDLTGRLEALAKQIGTGQPMSHKQFRQLHTALVKASAALVSAGDTDEDDEE